MTPGERANAQAATMRGDQVIAIQRCLLPLALLGVVVIVGALFWPTVESLLVEWLDTDKRVYTHGPLVACLGIWLLLRANAGRDLEQPGASRNTIPVIVVALLSVIWLVVYRAGIQVGHQALLPIILWFAIWSALGHKVAWRSTIPVLILYSAIPVWDVGIGTLQSLTVAVVGAALKIFGVPAYVAGNFVTIPSGTFEVADGCAGIHYFVVAITIAALYGELQRDSLKIRMLLLILAAALAMVTNWLRVFVIVVAGHLSDMQHYLVRVDHYYFGWVLFAFAMLAFFLIARRFPGGAQDPKQVLAAPQERLPLTTIAMHGTIAVIALAVGPLCSVIFPIKAASSINVVLPDRLNGWSGPHKCELGWAPRFPSADSHTMLEYRLGGRSLCAYTASYLLQRQGKEVVGYENSLFGGDEPEVIASTHQDVAGWSLNELRVAGRDSRDLLVWYTYALGEANTPSEIIAQLRYGLASLTSDPASTLFAVSALCLPDCAAAHALLRRFVIDSKLGTVPTAAVDPGPAVERKQ